MADINEVHKQVEKEYPNTALYGESLKEYSIPRMRTNIFMLDLLTGGGIPLGKYTKIWGAKYVGKSALALMLAGVYQSLYPDKHVLLMDYENSYDPLVAKYLLTDMDRITVIPPEYAEQGIEIHKKYLQAEEIGFVIVDSVGAMVPIDMAESEAIKDHMGLHPKAVNKMFRQTEPILIRARRQGRQVTTILTNQRRANFGGGAYSSDMTPGGNVQEHAPSLELRLYTGQNTSNYKNRYKFTVQKNRGYPKKLSGEYVVYTSNHRGYRIGEIDELKDVVTYAQRCGVIPEKKDKYDVLGHKFANQQDVAKALREDKELFYQLKEKTIETCLQSEGGLGDE